MSTVEFVGQVPSVGVARGELRRATAKDHEALHRQPGFARLMAGNMAAHEYSTLLARLYGFRHSLELAFRAVTPDVAGRFDLLAREKGYLMRADLTARIRAGAASP